MINEANIQKGDTWEDIDAKWYDLGYRHGRDHIMRYPGNDSYMEGYTVARRKVLRDAQLDV